MNCETMQLASEFQVLSPEIHQMLRREARFAKEIVRAVSRGQWWRAIRLTSRVSRDAVPWQRELGLIDLKSLHAGTTFRVWCLTTF